MLPLYPTMSTSIPLQPGDQPPHHRRRPTLTRAAHSLAFGASDLPSALASTLVIVVDDEPAVVAVVCDVLDDAGIAVSSCPYGRQAASCIWAKQPQIAILDVQMPIVDGIQLFEQLRADPATATLPVIFLTANSHILQQRVPDYLARGAVLVPKPFRNGPLVTIVLALLGQPGRP